MTLSVIIPAYNEAATIATLIERVQAVPLFEKELIVVGDGSTAGTWGLLQAFANAPNITLLRHERNQGKGAALRDGFARAANDIVIVQDADLEYEPERVSKAHPAYSRGPRGCCLWVTVHRRRVPPGAVLLARDG